MESYDAVLVTLIGDVAATYVELRALDERLDLAEKNAELQKSSLELASERKKKAKFHRSTYRKRRPTTPTLLR